MNAPTTIAPIAAAPPSATSRAGRVSRALTGGRRQIRTASRTTAAAPDARQYGQNARITEAEIHVRYTEKPTAPAAIANAACQRPAVKPATASPPTAA